VRRGAHISRHSGTEGLADAEVLECTGEAGFAGVEVAVRVEAPEEVGPVQADADEEDFGDEEAAVDGEVCEGMVERGVGFHGVVRGKSTDEAHEIFVELEHVSVLATVSDLLEVVDHTAHDGGKGMSEDDEGHAGGGRQWGRAPDHHEVVVILDIERRESGRVIILDSIWSSEHQRVRPVCMVQVAPEMNR
jgi:hypothetical protein